MPDACNNVVCHGVLFAVAEPNAGKLAKPSIVWDLRCILIFCSDSVNDVAFDFEILGTSTSDTELDEVMNHIVFKRDRLRVLENDALTKT
jgi:hypothetical protein